MKQGQVPEFGISSLEVRSWAGRAGNNKVSWERAFPSNGLNIIIATIITIFVK